MRYIAIPIFLLSLHCATINSICCRDNPEGNYIYSGIRCIGGGCWNTGGIGGFLVGGLFVIDFPLSLLLDTILLPVTIPVTFYYIYSKGKEQSEWSLVNAVRNNYLERVRALLSEGINIDTPRAKSRYIKGSFIGAGSMLIITCVQYNCSTELLTLLIDNGADVNSYNSSGQTPLILAIQDNSFALTRALILNGAKVCMRGKYTSSAIDIAKDIPAHFTEAKINTRVKILDLLLKSKAGADCENSHN